MNNPLFSPLYPLIIQLFFLLLIPFVKKQKLFSTLSHILILTGLTAGFGSTFISLITGNLPLQGVSIWGIPNESFRIDSLALYFLAIIQLVAIPTTIYSYSYVKHYIDKEKPINGFVIIYALMLVSTQLVVIVNHSIIFLICWEVMSITSYLGMVFEKEKEEVQRGSFYYLIISHVIGFLLYIFFFLLHNESNSWLISDFHILPSSGNIFIILYALSLIAFGMKAGFMPFHFWLPRAHPIAPTVFSTFLSGVIIKTGIYGILRTYQILNPAPEWIGWSMLGVAMFTAVFGVWYALAQHDIKKLLAYHSVENIGIIGIGIGIGFIGSSYNSIPIQILGFGGALLHTLNHAIFKSLLFIGSGIIYQNLGTREIELMGGLVNKAKYFVILFLIGSVAISGIPPFNGFISEFILYNGFFVAAEELRGYYPLLMLISMVVLALVGGLAVACFTKINSIMFLGSERKEPKPFEVSIFDYTSLTFLAILCVIIGFYPLPFIGIVNRVLSSGFIPANSSGELFSFNWMMITFVFISILTGILLVYFWKRRLQKKYGRKISDPWGCGYDQPSPRMQYSASSFADELNEVSKTVLVYKKKTVAPTGIFPQKGSLSSHSYDLVDYKIILKVYNYFSSILSRIEIMSQTDIRYYIAFILGALTLYSILAIIWI